MAKAEYKLLVDWDNAGDFSHSEADITADFLDISARRGRDRISTLTGRSTAGTLQVTLRNPEGKYASFNADSPLYGLILPRRKVQWQMRPKGALLLETGDYLLLEDGGRILLDYAWVPLWTGWLETIVPSSTVGELATAVLRASGSLWIWQQDSARTEPQADIATGDAIAAIADAIDWPAGLRDFDAGEVTMPYWFAGGKALDEARGVEDVEIGFIREDAEGKVVFEGKYHRLTGDSLVSQQTYTDEGATIGYRAIDQADPFADVYRTFRASTVVYEVGGLDVLWEVDTNTKPYLLPGDSAEWVASYPRETSPVGTAGVNEWTTPAANTDYMANSAADGSGDDLTGDLDVDVVKSATEMRITITNNASVTAYLVDGAGDVLLQARGTPITGAGVAVSHEVEDSPVQAEWPSPARHLPSTQDARDHVRFLGAIHGKPNPMFSIAYIANRSDATLLDAQEREVSDRVTVKSNVQTYLGIDDDAFVEAIHHVLDRDGRHGVQLDVYTTRSIAPFWVLGVGILGRTTVLV